MLHDDGRQIVARASGAQAETLAGLGFELVRLGDPLVWTTARPADVTPTLITYDPLVAEMIGQVQQSTVYTYTSQLSGASPAVVGGASYTITSRNTASGTPIEKATQYVYEHMQALGLNPSYQTWTSGSYSGRNVIGVKAGAVRTSEIVLVTAHLDDMPSSGLAPGADDNASGSVGVLVAADILSRYRFERTVRFVFFTGEEQGLLGSQAYADAVYGAGQDIVAVYNMDMIAWNNVNGPTLRIHTRAPSNPAGYAADLAHRQRLHEHRQRLRAVRQPDADPGARTGSRAATTTGSGRRATRPSWPSKTTRATSMLTTTQPTTGWRTST